MNALTHGSKLQGTLNRLLTKLWHDESGQDVIEYALIAVAMGLFTVAGVHGLASSISNDIYIITNAFTGVIHIP